MNFNFLIYNFIFLTIISKFFLIYLLIKTFYFNLKKEKKLFFQRFKNVFVIFLPFIAFGLISNIINKINFTAHIGFSLIVFYIFCAVSIANYFSKNQLIFRKTLQMLFYINIILIVDILVYKNFNYSLATLYANNSSVGVRYGSFFFDERVAGSFILYSLPLILLYLNKYCLPQDQYFKKNWIILALFLISIIYLTGERRSFFLGCACLVFIPFFKITNLSVKNFFLILIIFAFFCIGSFTTYILIKKNNDQDINSLNNRMVVNTVNIAKSFTLLLNDREKYKLYIKENNIGNWAILYKDTFSLSIKKKQTIVTGIGYRQYQKECIKNNLVCSTHPHNMFLEIYISYGVFGLLLFIFLLYKVIKTLLKNNYKNNLETILFIFIFFFPLFPTGSILAFGLTFNLLIYSSLYLANYYIEKSKIHE